MGERDPAKEQPARFDRAVRAACCDACNYPECGCETTAEIIRKALRSWESLPDKAT